ncbi:MAG: hypothetical protein EOM83_02000 [Clostridia bacterium]|nr:hypothetical protein [Clostridia bacterium]
MKIPFFIGLCLSLLLVLPMCVKSQVVVQLYQPPPNQWQIEDIWNLTLFNTTNQTLSVYLHGTVEEDGEGLIFEGTSAIFELPPNFSGRVNPRDLEPADAGYANGDYEEYVLRTGTMPEGTYTFCVAVFNSITDLQLGIDCYTQFIIPFTPPELISPEYESIVIEPFPFFLWLPPMPLNPANSFVYQLKVVEQLDDQLPFEAMEANPAFFIQQNIQNTSFQLPVSARPFEIGNKYAWQVTAFIGMYGKDEIGKSEVWSFEKIEVIEPPDAELPDCDLYSIEFKKTITGDSCYYKLSLINNDSLASEDLLPQSFTLSIKNDSIKAFDKKAAITWEQAPSKINDPLAKMDWKYKPGHIPIGKTYIGKVFLQGEPENIFRIIYSWNDKKGKTICKDSIAFNEPISYYDLSNQPTQGYIGIYDEKLNIRFINNYAPSKVIYIGIFDALTMELAGSLTSEDLLENNPYFFVGHGLNQLSINLEGFSLQEDTPYLLTLYDIKNYHYLKFKALFNHEEN